MLLKTPYKELNNSVKTMMAISVSIRRLMVAPVRIRFHNRFICKRVNISVYALFTGGWIKYLPA